MTEDHGLYLDRKVDEAFDQLAEQRRKVDELGRMWKEETTTVPSRDRSFSLVFDGRGDLSDVTFHGTRYRTLAPAELAHMLVDTVRAGRLTALERMADIMRSDDRPDVDFVGMATGKVDPATAVEALIGPMFDEIGMPDPTRRRDRG